MNLPWTKATRRAKAQLKLKAQIQYAKNMIAVAKSEHECGQYDLACMLSKRAGQLVVELERCLSDYARLYSRSGQLKIASE